MFQLLLHHALQPPIQSANYMLLFKYCTNVFDLLLQHTPQPPIPSAQNMFPFASLESRQLEVESPHTIVLFKTAGR